MAKRYSKQRLKKLFNPICFFCGENDYAILDVHRIVPGSAGGSYRYDNNTLVVCSNCHRKVHSGKIVIDKKYPSTVGPTVHYFYEGVEYWRIEYEKGL